MNEERRQRWEKALELPLMALAIAFLVAYALPILHPEVDPALRTVSVWVTWGAWVCFVTDYLVRLRLTVDRAAFVRTNLLDLAVVVLPILRPLRLLRLVTLLSVLNRHAGASLRGRVAIYVSGAASLVLFVSAPAVLDAERGHRDANIETFADASWWAMTTVTTVGYGDRFPVTMSGRFIAAGLMLAGIALLGVVTASFASWLIERVQQVEEESEAATRRDVAALAAEIEALRTQLAGATTKPPHGV